MKRRLWIQVLSKLADLWSPRHHQYISNSTTCIQLVTRDESGWDFEVKIVCLTFQIPAIVRVLAAERRRMNMSTCTSHYPTKLEKQVKTDNDVINAS